MGARSADGDGARSSDGACQSDKSCSQGSRRPGIRIESLWAPAGEPVRIDPRKAVARDPGVGSVSLRESMTSGRAERRIGVSLVSFS